MTLDETANGFLNDCLEALEKPSKRFYMRNYFWWEEQEEGNYCGTPACVLGHYVAHKGEIALKASERQWIEDRCFTIRGGDRPSVTGNLTHNQLSDLFSTYGCDDAATPEAAIRYIQKFILDHGGSLRKLPVDAVTVMKASELTKSVVPLLEKVPV